MNPSMMRVSAPLLFLATGAAFWACGPTEPAPSLNEGAAQILTGDYLGQTPPGPTPELFAPGIVTTGIYTRDVAMAPEGDHLFFGVLFGSIATIVETHRGPDGVWSQPEVAPFSRDSRFFSLEPHIAPDGGKLLFLTTRVENPGPEDLRSWTNQDIWVVDREGEGWGEPYPLGAGVNSTSSQYNAFIAPDESYLILCTGERDDTRGGADYYVTFRSPDDRWSGPINMGEVVNTPRAAEFSPYVSPDGRYFFFMSTRPMDPEKLPDTLTWEYLKGFREMPETGNPGIYWMDASFIQELRPQGF